MDKFLSQDQHKISECSTGNKVTEEWTFLPSKWKHRLFERKCLFDQNFALLYFANDSFLLLNLVTRVEFWIKRTIIENEMKRRVPDFEIFDGDGHPFIFDNNTTTTTKMGKMTVGSHKIQIPYQMEFNGGEVFLGSFNIPK